MQCPHSRCTPVAAGYTHIFSQNLVNYFNPWIFMVCESVRAQRSPENTLAAFPIVLQSAGANAPFTTVGGLDNTCSFCRAGGASRVFLNDNLAWTDGAHELRFTGTNARIFRLNDYDFGEGSVPTVTYTDLPQFIYGVASHRDGNFPCDGQRTFSAF